MGRSGLFLDKCRGIDRPPSIAARLYPYAYLAVVVLAAVLRFWALDGGLPHLLTRPDEEVVLVQSRVPASGSLDLSHDVYQYSVYSTAYVVLSWAWAEGAHAAFQVVGATPPGDYLTTLDREPWRILLALRSLSAFAGVVSVALLMFFVRRELGRTAAVIAGLLLATSLFHVRESHYAKPDALLVLVVVAALGWMAPLGRAATYRRAIGVGVSIGLGMSIKYPALLLLAPAWVCCAVGTPARGWRRLVPPAGAVVVASAALAFLASSPDALFNEQTRAHVLTIVTVVFPSLFSAETLDAAQSRAVSEAASTRGLGEGFLAGFSYYYGFALRWGSGLLALVVAPAAVVWGLVSRKPLPMAAAVYTVVSLVVLSMSPALLTRYFTPLLPALAVLMAGVIGWATRRVPRNRLAAVAVAACVLVAEPFAYSVAFDRLLSRTDTRVLATRWLADHGIDGKVAMVGTVFWGWGEPEVPSPAELVRVDPTPEALARAGVDFVIAHDHEVFASSVDPKVLGALVPDFELAHRWSPFLGDREEAVYDAQDAYYVPVTGFGVVERPGPDVRIYRRRVGR